MASKVKRSSRLYRKFGLRFISFFMSFLIWFHVINSEPIEKGQQIKLSVYPPKNKAIVSDIPHHIYFTLRGPRAFLNASNLQKQKVIVNLDSLDPHSKNQYRIQYDSNMISLPFGVQTTGMNPPYIDITVDKKIRKQVSLEANIVGKLDKDYEFVYKRVTPSQVWVNGPKKLLKDVKSFESQIVDVSEFQDSGKIELKFQEIGEFITFESNDKILFEYKIRPTKSNYTLDKLPIYFLGTQRKFKTKAKFASVSVLVPNKEYVLKNSEVRIIAEIPENMKGKVRVKLKAELPKDIHLLQIHPEYIMVNL